MRFSTLIGLSGLLICLAMALGACQTEPPTVVYIVLSPTPSGAAPEVTPEATTLVTAETTEVETSPTDTAVTVVASPTTAPATITTTTRATDLPPNFPTPVTARIQVVEQLFERGRMFWLEPNKEIWVLVITGEGRGTWTAYEDTWVEGTDPDSDPSLTAPEGLIQPVRGFGKLWRDIEGLRDQIGWAVTPEFGYLSDYEYRAGGSVDSNGQYTAGPGSHTLYSLYGERFAFYEADATWQLGGS